MSKLENTPVAIMMKHGEDDFTLWQPDIPADDPFWLALLEKYADCGCSERGSRKEIADSMRESLGGGAEQVHLIVYNDPISNYVGIDAFASYEAAVQQFDARLSETKAEHADDSEWIETLDRDVGKKELHFCTGDSYEVFYLEERIQKESEMRVHCSFCGRPFPLSKLTRSIHRCPKCQRYFCNFCYETMTGEEDAAERDLSHSSCCPYCFLRESVQSKLADWLGDYASRMPDSFLCAVVSDVEECSGFYDEGGFTEDDIRLAFARVVARQFDVEV